MLKWSNISNGLRFSCKSIFGRFDSLGKRTIRYSPWCKRTRYYSTSFLSESLVLTIFEGDFLNPFALIRKRLANSGLGLLTQRLGGNLHSDRCQTNALICTVHCMFIGDKKEFYDFQFGVYLKWPIRTWIHLLLENGNESNLHITKKLKLKSTKKITF